MEKSAKSIYNMIKKHVFTCSVFFIFISCNKRDKECYEKYQDLYLKQYTLWFGSESHPEIKLEKFLFFPSNLSKRFFKAAFSSGVLDSSIFFSTFDISRIF